MTHAELVAQLDAAADRLTTRVLAEMYVDPFWHARFAERAERHGRQDGRFHIDYLIQAMHAASPAIIENYARWLQQVLTSRGMCTRHLDENFERLAAAIADEAWPDRATAVDLLTIARAALRYPPGPAREIQRTAPALSGAMANEIYGHAEDVDPAERRYLAVDLVIYAADAIALAQPAVFTRHVLWLAGFLDRRGTPGERLVHALHALTHAGTAIAPTAAEAVHGVVGPALVALAALVAPVAYTP
ncbi:MAG TPA: hypothetical protein VH165_07490 [Kofleriaceae bacterium]|jgi:hypothetical protein|nr:hypothetical protein [Kofleriaceae bacterium]